MSLRKTVRKSTDYGNRDITFRAVGDGAGISVPHDTKTKATSWAVEEESTSVPNAWDSSTSTYTVLESGYYDTSFQTYVSETIDEDLNYLLNEIEIDGNLASASGNGGNRGGEVNRDLYARADIQNKWLSKGQEIEFYTRQKNANGQTLTYGSSNSLDFISIAKRHSPQSIAASEKVFAELGSDNGISLGTSNPGSGLQWSDVISDSHGKYDNSTGIYEVPVAGSYSVDLNVRTSADATSDNQFLMAEVYVNGSVRASRLNEAFSGQQSMSIEISKLLTNLSRGDEIEVRVWSDINTSRSLDANSASSWFNIYKI